MKKITWIVIVGLLLLFGVIATFAHYESSTVQVSRFYNGHWGYTLSVPTGNEAMCVWTFAGGTGHVPTLQLTAARNTEKHSLATPEDVLVYEDWKVTCVDDFGNSYMGIFPSNL